MLYVITAPFRRKDLPHATHQGHVIQHILTSEKRVGTEILEKVYAGFDGGRQSGVSLSNGIGPFGEIEELHNFLLRVAEELGVEKIYILDLDEFNEGLKTLDDIENFYALFDEGTVLERSRGAWERPKFLRRIFKEG